MTVIEPKKLESVILHTKGCSQGRLFETHPKMSRCDERPSTPSRSTPTVHLWVSSLQLNWCSSSAQFLKQRISVSQLVPNIEPWTVELLEYSANIYLVEVMKKSRKNLVEFEEEANCDFDDQNESKSMSTKRKLLCLLSIALLAFCSIILISQQLISRHLSRTQHTTSLTILTLVDPISMNRTWSQWIN